MVDVGGKTASKRRAIAEARVTFPSEVAGALRASGLRSAERADFRHRHHRRRHGCEAHS